VISVTEPRKAFQYFFGNSIPEGDHAMMQDHPKQDPVGLPTRAKHNEIVELTDKDLAGTAAGTGTTFLRFDFALVAVKTISWSGK
jgi:hypothetical protein